MRKLYLLLVWIVIAQTLKAQDTANFNFSFGPNNIVTFTNLSVIHGNDLRKAYWTFGDGIRQQTLPLAGTQHQYANIGNYTACLRIYRYNSTNNDSFITGEICKPLVVPNGICGSGFSLSPVPATPKARIFTAIPSHSLQKKPLKVCWTFGDGHDTCILYSSTYTGAYSVAHTYAFYGQYNMCVKINYDGGCESQTCHTESILAPTGGSTDSCTFTINEGTPSPNYLVRKFFIGLQPNKVGLKICWMFGDGTDTCVILSNPPTQQQLGIEHLYPAPGNYPLCVKVYYDGGCIVQKCRPVIINTQGINTNLCGGYMTDSLMSAANVSFKGFSINKPTDHVISWKWTFGDGTQATTQNATHVYASGGTYPVCLTIRTDFGCETKICKNLVVQANPNNAQLVASPNPVTSGLHLAFNSSLQEQMIIDIYNANGILVRTYTRSAVAGPNGWDFDLTTLPPGMYTVIVHSNNQFATSIIFKQ
jgi:PKD repeat protein